MYEIKKPHGLVKKYMNDFLQNIIFPFPCPSIGSATIFPPML